MAERMGRWLRSVTFISSVLLATPGCTAGQAKSHVFGNPDAWQWTPNHTYHVENYRLALRFDEPKAEVFGDDWTANPQND